MKKRLLSIAFVAAIAATASWNFTQSENKVNLSDLALTNVEALAQCEKIAGSCWMSTAWVCCDAGETGCSPCGY